MGCANSTAKTVSPKLQPKVQFAAEPATLLNNTSRDQQEIKLGISSRSITLGISSRSFSVSQFLNSQGKKEAALRAEALRVFDLAVKDDEGRLDMKLFSRVANTYVSACANDMLLDLGDVDIYLKDCVTRHEWLAYFSQLSEADETIARVALAKYQKHLVEHQNVLRSFAVHTESVPSDWQLHDEVVRIFALADKDQNGQVDIEELTNVRNSHQGAEAMMLKADLDFTGTLSQDEWVAYFYWLSLKNEKSAAALLRLYEKQIGQDKIIHLARATTTEIIDNQNSIPLMHEL